MITQSSATGTLLQYVQMEKIYLCTTEILQVYDTLINKESHHTPINKESNQADI